MNATLPGIRALLVAVTATALAAQKSPEEALRALTDGNLRFAADKSIPQPVGEGVRRTLARGQNPFAVVVCCSDSRVPPEHIFNCGLGELFVIRIAGNTCDREALASIEYAVEHLNTPLCVVLGHEGCGAVHATIEQVQALDLDHAAAAPSPAIQGLIEQIEPAVRKARARDLGGKALHDACEEENAHRCLHESMRRSPLLRRYVQTGRLQMKAARYHLGSGEVEWLPSRPVPPEPQLADAHTMDPVPASVPPHVALRMLQAGHRRFLGDGLPAGDLSADRRQTLTHGQQPLAIVLTCADSRVAPEHVFDSGLGELFVIRVAGNVVNNDVLASIEYAATHAGSSLLVVMGHTRCGAITAAASHPEGTELTPNMRALLARLEPSVEKVRGQGARPQDVVELAVQANVLRAAMEVRSRSAILRQLEQHGNFAILPTVYDIASGNLTWLEDVRDDAHPAAPVGETAPSPGGPGGHDDPHAQPDPGRESPEQGGGGHGNDGHAEETVPNTVLDWADPVSPPAHSPVAHGAGDSHGNDAADDGSHNQGRDVDDGHAPHNADVDGVRGHAAESAEHGPNGKKDGNPWRDPIVIVGMAGVASLLLASLIAVIKRD